MKKRPNIVMFIPDHYRGDTLGHLGNLGAYTPNLDKLASEGVSFSNTYCQNPVCSPSRCSFLSGWYPHVMGHRTMNHLMQPNEQVILKTLKDAGYWTWFGGKNDVVAAQFGFHDYCNVKFEPHPSAKSWLSRKPDKEWRGSLGDDTFYAQFRGKIELEPGESMFWDLDLACVSGAIDLIKEAPEGRPMCIYLPLIFPHLPFCVEEPWFSKINRSKVPSRIPTPTDWSTRPAIEKMLFENYGMKTWTEERWRELKAVYYGMCSRQDYLVGLVVDALKNKGIWDDTLFMFFSDHGEYAGDYGLIDINQNTFEDSLTKVPLIIKPPASIKIKNKGERKELVELLDIVATIEEIAGVSMPQDHFSKSLVPLITDSNAEHRDAVFSEGGRLNGEFQAYELDVGQALVPQGKYFPRLKIQRSNGHENGKAVMCRTKDYKFISRLYEKSELYDLRTDPQELINRIEDQSLTSVVSSMKDRVLKFFLETGDIVPRTIDKRGE
jgi:arylsulfatase A-like enzyme